MKVAKQFGRNLSTARKEAGLTQEEVAEQGFVDRVALSRLENGRRCPRLDLVVILAEVVGVQVRDLLHGIE
jgi:transcriptional regulator with XRE-family HTH domain